MATTPGGLPYPVGTDLVVDGDNAIRALAEAVEAKYGSGARTFAATRLQVPANATKYGLLLNETVANATVPAFTFATDNTTNIGTLTLQTGFYSFTVAVHMGELAPAGSYLDCTIASVSAIRGYASGAGADWISASGIIRVGAADKPIFSVYRAAGGNTRDVTGILQLIRLRSL